MKKKTLLAIIVFLTFFIYKNISQSNYFMYEKALNSMERGNYEVAEKQLNAIDYSYEGYKDTKIYEEYLNLLNDNMAEIEDYIELEELIENKYISSEDFVGQNPSSRVNQDILNYIRNGYKVEYEKLLTAKLNSDISDLTRLYKISSLILTHYNGGIEIQKVEHIKEYTKNQIVQYEPVWDYINKSKIKHNLDENLLNCNETCKEIGLETVFKNAAEEFNTDTLTVREMYGAYDTYENIY